MSAIVDYSFYSSVYMGTEADQASFPALYAHASRTIAILTKWQVREDNFSGLNPFVQSMYRLAICSQIDFFAENGIESVNDTGGAGFTVGKVTVHGRTGASSGGAMSASISPAAKAFLEQTGLMNPSVPVVEGIIC